MFSVTPLIRVQCSFSNPEDLTALFKYLHDRKVSGKWTAHHGTHFDGTFAPEDAQHITRFLKNDLGIPEKS